MYTGPVYARDTLDARRCPWCVADGSAAEWFDATFMDEYGLLNDPNIAPAIAEEVCKRTAGYCGWQHDVWLTHCNDACAYLGFPAVAEFDGELAPAVAELIDIVGMFESEWQNMRRARVPEGYQPQGHVGLYTFRCLHCGTFLLASDSE
jgi:uncharacterized protein